MTAIAMAQPAQPLAEIEGTLRHEVIDVLRNFFVDLAGMDRGAAYETVMNQPSLLHDAFMLLKRDPKLFDGAIRDENGQPVEAKDDTKLRCGETLGHIKALVLRASAKRHFRRTLGGPRMVPTGPQMSPSLFRRIGESLGLVKPRIRKKKRVPGRGDSLYQAIRDYLKYDWQAQLIPHYTQLTPALIAALGETLYEVREPGEVAVICGEEGRAAIAENRRPLLFSSARSIMTQGTDSIDSELLWKLWDQMGMIRLFGEIDLNETRKVIAEVAATSRTAVNRMMPILGKDVRHFITFLFMAYFQLGRNEFRNVFTDAGVTGWMSKIYAERLARLEELPPPTLADMREVFGEVLAPLKSRI